MHLWQWLRDHLSGEHVGWFGAGLGTAAVGVLGYQFIAAALLAGPWPGPQAVSLQPTASARPTASATRTPFPTRTPTATPSPSPTRTATPTRTPMPAPVDGVAATLATLTVAEPDAVVAVVATFAARTNAALEPLLTPNPRR